MLLNTNIILNPFDTVSSQDSYNKEKALYNKDISYSTVCVGGFAGVLMYVSLVSVFGVCLLSLNLASVWIKWAHSLALL